MGNASNIGAISSDEVLSRMKGDIEKAAETIKETIRSPAPILIRYHGDCDGICAALLIYLSIKRSLGREGWEQCRKRMIVFKNPSAIYEVSSVVDDVELVRNMQLPSSPLAILLDFSTNSESLNSLNALRKSNFNLLIIDHHPLSEEVAKVAFVVSPWLHGGDSRYSAGFIAGEVAKRVSHSDEFEEFQKISLVGDKSPFIAPQEELTKKAIVLDFIATSSDFAESLDLYHSILEDRNKMESIYDRAMRKIEFVRKDAVKYSRLREFDNGFKVLLVRLDKFRVGEFPGKGKITGEVHDEFDKKLNTPLVTVGYGERAMHIRANGKAREAGFNANQLISELKAEMRDAIESGGGHDVAAGLRVNEGFERMVLEEITKKIGRIGK